jgi:hypothetical protein
MIILFWTPFAVYMIIDNLVSIPEHAVLVDHPSSSQETRSLRSTLPLFDFVLFYVGRHDAHHECPHKSVAMAWEFRSDVSTTYLKFYTFTLAQLPLLNQPTHRHSKS